MKIDFEQEKQKEVNIKILSHLNKINDLTEEEIEQLKLIVLWESIETFDKKRGCKFTTHLYNTCKFTFLKHINKRKEVFVDLFDEEYSQTTSIFEDLPKIHRTVLEDRYVYRYSILEMGRKYKIKKNDVKTLIKNSEDYLKKSLTN